MWYQKAGADKKGAVTQTSLNSTAEFQLTWLGFISRPVKVATAAVSVVSKVPAVIKVPVRSKTITPALCPVPFILRPANIVQRCLLMLHLLMQG